MKERLGFIPDIEERSANPAELIKHQILDSRLAVGLVSLASTLALTGCTQEQKVGFETGCVSLVCNYVFLSFAWRLLHEETPVPIRRGISLAIAVGSLALPGLTHSSIASFGPAVVGASMVAIGIRNKMNR